MIPLADDFATIRARLAEIQSAPSAWWCDDCQLTIGAGAVTGDGLHDEAEGGCGCKVREIGT